MPEPQVPSRNPTTTSNVPRQRTVVLDNIEQGIAPSTPGELQYPPSSHDVNHFLSAGSTAAQDNSPPLLVKVTGYRIMNTTIILVLGVWKSVASYRGEAILSTSLDLVAGAVLAVILYWLGLYETVEPPRMRWLFHDDYAAICCRPRPRRQSRPLQTRASSVTGQIIFRDGRPTRSPSPIRMRTTDRSPPTVSADDRRSTLQQWDTSQLQWQRGRPPFYNYIDAVLLPDVPRDKAYTFRVQKGNIDLGTHPTYPPEDNGSQKVNFLEYNEGYGIRDDTSIGVYARDPETESEHLVAQWR